MCVYVCACADRSIDDIRPLLVWPHVTVTALTSHAASRRHSAEDVLYKRGQVAGPGRKAYGPSRGMYDSYTSTVGEYVWQKRPMAVWFF